MKNAEHDCPVHHLILGRKAEGLCRRREDMHADELYEQMAARRDERSAASRAVRENARKLAFLPD